MKVDLKAIREKASTFLAGFSTGQKAVSVVAILALVIGGFMMVSWSSKPDYVPLYSNLSSQDASAITSKLTANKTPYKLADNGQTIMVPGQKVYQLRLDMSSAGLPSGSAAGYSLLDKQGIT